jgi:hypothetical protein
VTAPKPNAELAYRVLDHIDAHPETWMQDRWWVRDAEIWIEGKDEPDCGTAGCFAGWACTLSGETPRKTPYKVVAGPDDLEVPERAAQLLGFADWDALDYYHGEVADRPCDTWLFNSSNTRDALGRLVAEIFGPRPAGDAS